VPPRYFEIIITRGQLAALVVGVALAIAVAFALGLGVQVLQPHEAPAVVAAVATPAWPPGPPVVPTAAAAVGTVPTPLPTSTPLPPTPEAPRPTAPSVAAPPNRVARWVQVAALSTKKQAEGARNRVVALGFTPRQVVVEAAGGKFRVRVGPFPDVESAGRVAARLRAEGFRGAFLVKPGE
jgi:cell division protein FtsN